MSTASRSSLLNTDFQMWKKKNTRYQIIIYFIDSVPPNKNGKEITKMAVGKVEFKLGRI